MPSRSRFHPHHRGHRGGARGQFLRPCHLRFDAGLGRGRLGRAGARPGRSARAGARLGDPRPKPAQPPALARRSARAGGDDVARRPGPAAADDRPTRPADHHWPRHLHRAARHRCPASRLQARGRALPRRRARGPRDRGLARGPDHRPCRARHRARPAVRLHQRAAVHQDPLRPGTAAHGRGPGEPGPGGDGRGPDARDRHRAYGARAAEGPRSAGDSGGDRNTPDACRECPAHAHRGRGDRRRARRHRSQRPAVLVAAATRPDDAGKGHDPRHAGLSGRPRLCPGLGRGDARPWAG
jgi:hypothetical protein